MAQLEATEMLANTFEPKRKFRWIFSIDGIDSFTAKTASRPQATFDETVIDYINVKRYLAGKTTWTPLNISLYDPIAPSATQKVWEWFSRCFENVTGRMGYAIMYKQDITLRLLDPVGSFAEEWLLQGTWIQDMNFGDLDYATSDPVDITLILRFDQALMQY